MSCWPRSFSALMQWLSVALAYAILALPFIFSDANVYHGAPAVIFGIPINIVWGIVIVFLVGATMSALLTIRLAKSSATESRAKTRLFVVLPSVAAVIYLIAVFGLLVNVEHYRYVPSAGDSSRCHIIYSINSGMGGVESGRFYIAPSSWTVGTPTKYAWSSNGHGGVSNNEWEVRWKSEKGTLITYGQIGIDPDNDLPAHFTCLH